MLCTCLAAVVAVWGVVQPKAPEPAPASKQPVTPTKKDAPAPGATATPDPAKPLVPFPHPLISEVLYNVPTGDRGDANKDGTRQVAGDEFVELINPHDKPINLGGYTLSDMTAQEKTSSGKPKGNSVRWTFPPLSLKPGQVVVVFNGNASTIAGAVGDSSAAPAKGNDLFHGAFVFSMRQPSDKVSFANTADWVMLSAPDGKPVEVIKWGEPRVKVPAGVLLVEEAPSARAGSVQRTAANGALAVHPTDGSVSFSPGLFVMPAPAEPEAKKPEKPTQPAAPAAAPPAKTEPASAGPEKPVTEKPATPEPSKKPKF